MKTIFAAVLLATSLSTSVASAQVVLKMASNAHVSNPPTVGDQVAFEWLQREIEERTNGEVELQIFWGGALGAEASLMGALESGGLDIVPNTPANVGGLLPKLGLFSVGYLFENFGHFKTVVNDEKFFSEIQRIVEETGANYSLVGIGATGSRNLYNRIKVVRTPEDVEGMKMRVQASPVEYEVWSTLKMLPSNIPSPEIYMALQSGVVDASESSIPFIVSNKYYEVAPFITMTNHQISTHLYFMNNKSLQKVPEEYREALLGALREAGNLHIDATERLSEENLDELRETPGVTVTEVDVAPFAELIAPLQDKIAADLGVQNLLEIIRTH